MDSTQAEKNEALKYALSYFHSQPERIEAALKAGGDPNCLNSIGEPLIMDQFVTDDILRLFVDHGADLTQKDRRGYNVLHVHANHPTRLKFILETCPETREFVNDLTAGSTPLQAVADVRNMESARLLCEEYGGDPTIRGGVNQSRIVDSVQYTWAEGAAYFQEVAAKLHPCQEPEGKFAKDVKGRREAVAQGECCGRC